MGQRYGVTISEETSARLTTETVTTRYQIEALPVTYECRNGRSLKILKMDARGVDVVAVKITDRGGEDITVSYEAARPYSGPTFSLLW